MILTHIHYMYLLIICLFICTIHAGESADFAFTCQMTHLKRTPSMCAPFAGLCCQVPSAPPHPKPLRLEARAHGGSGRARLLYCVVVEKIGKTGAQTCCSIYHNKQSATPRRGVCFIWVEFLGPGSLGLGPPT